MNVCYQAIRCPISAAAVALGMSLCAETAHAQPHYDVENWCRTVASSSGDYSDVINNGCMEQEQSSYDYVKTSWTSLSQSIGWGAA